MLKKHVDIVGCSIFIATFETTSESGGTTLRMVLALMVMMVDLHQRMHEALYYTFAADESALEEPRATCMQGDMVGYIKRRADTKQYLRLAPVTEQGRCVKPCAARRLPLEAILIMSVMLMNNTVWPISR